MAEDIRNMRSVKGIAEFEKQYEKPYCIILDSSYCSMGRMIGYSACQKTGYAYYDGATLLELVPEAGLNADALHKFEERLRKGDVTPEEIQSDPEFQKLDAIFEIAVNRAFEKGPCLIHDHAVKEEILSKGYTAVSVMTYAEDMKAKIVRARKSPLYENLTDDRDVIRAIKEEDEVRYNWHAVHSDTVWGEKETYDLMINTDAFGRDYAINLLSSIMQ